MFQQNLIQALKELGFTHAEALQAACHASTIEEAVDWHTTVSWQNTTAANARSERSASPLSQVSCNGGSRSVSPACPISPGDHKHTLIDGMLASRAMLSGGSCLLRTRMGERSTSPERCCRRPYTAPAQRRPSCGSPSPGPSNGYERSISPRPKLKLNVEHAKRQNIRAFIHQLQRQEPQHMQHSKFST